MVDEKSEAKSVEQEGRIKGDEFENEDKELLDKLMKIHGRQNEIKKIRFERKCSNLVGKYFKTDNSYSEGEDWFLYVKILRLDSRYSNLVVERFQYTTKNIIEFEISKWFPAVHISNYTEITEKEYETERRKLVDLVSSGAVY